MSKRMTIKIDESKCVGCGKCVNACKGSALELIDGKAKMTREDYCDGLGVCIGECPYGAITFEEKEVATTPTPKPVVTPTPSPCGGGCPGTASKSFTKKDKPVASASALNAWPIQLHLVRPEAEQFVNKDVLIAASCTAFSTGAFHSDYLEGKGLIIACPKLDLQEGYKEKLTDLFKNASPKSVSVLRMEVPCCSGLSALVRSARDAAGSDLEIHEIIIGLEGGEKGKNLI